MKNYTLTVVCSLSILTGRSAAIAEFYHITPATDLDDVISSVAAGDSIVLADGMWQDADLTFERLPGTADAPIRIQAQNAGNVIFTGKTQFRFSGQHVVVSGLVFRNFDGVSDVCQFRTHSERHAHHCRVTDCVFEQNTDFAAEKECRWMSLYGTHNRIDHCYLAGKTTRGTTLVVWVGDQPQYHRIDHNHFGPRPRLGKNGGETIRIGTSDVSEAVSKTVVEDNYFHACDGEAEIVSNKSCENVYRHNIFDECSGTLTLRHGHRCVVESNVFFGRTKSGTGGVRIIGRKHTVINNYFESLRGDAERAALAMMNGVPDSPLDEYAPVEQALVAHNTFIDCKVSLEFGVGAGKKLSVAPQNCRVIGNLLAPDKWQIFRTHSTPVGFVWADNRLSDTRKPRDPPVPFKQIPLTFERDACGLLRPTAPDHIEIAGDSIVSQDIDAHKRNGQNFCGCDDPTTVRRTPASATNTGPRWRTVKGDTLEN